MEWGRRIHTEYPSSSEMNFEVDVIVTLEKKYLKIVTLMSQFNMNEYICIGTSITSRKRKSKQLDILLLLLDRCSSFTLCFFSIWGGAEILFPVN